jgi:hypothetical protein
VKETPFASSKGEKETFHPTMTTGSGVMLRFPPCRDQVRPFLCIGRITTTKGLLSFPALPPLCASFPSFSIITIIVVLSLSNSPKKIIYTQRPQQNSKVAHPFRIKNISLSLLLFQSRILDNLVLILVLVFDSPNLSALNPLFQSRSTYNNFDMRLSIIALSALLSVASVSPEHDFTLSPTSR